MNLKLICFFLFISFSSFAQSYSNSQLDSIAKNIPEQYNVTTKSIAEYFKSISSDKRELSRMIFSWVAFHIKYDDESFNNSIYKSPDADSVLKERFAVCAGYSSIFKVICQQAGLEAVSIDGFAKGYGFKNGMPVNGINHSWNAVKYDDNWHLIDVTWGSGFAENVEGKAVSKSKFCDYFFDVNPSQFIFNHYPDSSQFQFLNRKITREQFRKLIYIDARCLFPLGFNADSILVKSKLNLGFTLPDVFCSENTHFQINQAPYSNSLNSNSKYYFEIKNNSNNRIVLLNNQELIEFDEQVLDKNIKSKSIEHLNRGHLYLGIATDNSVEIIVSYTVL